MGLQDREYMRRRRHNRLVAFKAKWGTWLVTAAAVIGVMSAGVWLIRDLGYLVGNFGPSEGSLIVNINTATQAQLESIPGIGPTRAVQIVAGRPYERVDELVEISGIGNATLESIRPFVTTDMETRRR